MQEFRSCRTLPGEMLLNPVPLLRDGDRERNRNRQPNEEGRVVGIVAGAIVAPAVIAAMPIPTVVASVSVVSMAAMVPSVVIPVIVVPVVIPSRMDGGTSVDSHVPGVNGTRIS